MPTQTYRAAQDTLARALTNNQHFVPEGTRDYAENRDMITEYVCKIHARRQFTHLTPHPEKCRNYTICKTNGSGEAYSRAFQLFPRM